MKTLKVDRQWAEKRVSAVLNSGILDLFPKGPEDIRFCKAIDLCMQLANDEDIPKVVEAIKDYESGKGD